MGSIRFGRGGAHDAPTQLRAEVLQHHVPQPFREQRCTPASAPTHRLTHTLIHTHHALTHPRAEAVQHHIPQSLNAPRCTSIPTLSHTLIHIGTLPYLRAEVVQHHVPQPPHSGCVCRVASLIASSTTQSVEVQPGVAAHQPLQLLLVVCIKGRRACVLARVRAGTADVQRVQVQPGVAAHQPLQLL